MAERTHRWIEKWLEAGHRVVVVITDNCRCEVVVVGVVAVAQ